MRAWLSTFLSLVLVMSQSVFASAGPEQEAVDKIAKAWKPGQTVAKTLEALRSKIPETHFKFISEKLASEKAGSKKAPKLIRRGPKEVSFDFNGTMFSLGVKNLESGDFFINQRLVKISAGDTPEEIWKKVESAYNVPHSAGLIDLMLPQAEAVAAIVGVALIALSVGALIYIANDYTCLQTSQAINDCENKILDFTTGNYATREPDPKRQIAAAKKITKRLEGIQKGIVANLAVCDETPKDLKKCLDRLAEQTKQTLKFDVHNHKNNPNLTGDADLDAAEGSE